MNFTLNRKIKNIMASILTIIALAILFSYFFNQSAVPESTSSLESQSGTSSSLGTTGNKEFKDETSYLSTLLSLNKITIDSSLFSNASFKSLKDNTVEIVGDGLVGRSNPFLPFDQQLNKTVVDLTGLDQVVSPNPNPSPNPNGQSIEKR